LGHFLVTFVVPARPTGFDVGAAVPVKITLVGNLERRQIPSRSVLAICLTISTKVPFSFALAYSPPSSVKLWEPIRASPFAVAQRNARAILLRLGVEGRIEAIALQRHRVFKTSERIRFGRVAE
jgi:hypothetical protein